MYEKIKTAIAGIGHKVEVKKHDEVGKVIFVINGIEIVVVRSLLEDDFHMNTATASNLILSLYRQEKRREL